jgi:urea carboxylase
VRIETWEVCGSEVLPFYDLMIGKPIVKGQIATRPRVRTALLDTRLGGIETNLDYLCCVIADKIFAQGRATTRYLNAFAYRSKGIEVIEPGVQSTIQDWPGRLGYWDVGVPPSGPMDALALRLANQLLVNSQGAAALECTASGPTLTSSSH